MAVEVHTDGSGGGGNTFLGFIVGALLLAVGVVGFFMWDGFKSGQGPQAPTAVIKVEKK
ncbi:MAG: hypothetical protein V4601_13915 [Pseudomonadota bacterium]